MSTASFWHSLVVETYRCFRVDRMQSWAQLTERIGRPRMTMLAEWRKRENIPE